MFMQPPSRPSVAVNPTVLIVMLGLLAVLGPLTIDLYLPAFPIMQQDLGTSPSSIQLTLTAATVGFALGQLAVGPWSDSIGRRVPLLIATSAHVVASIAIATAPDITFVLVLRVVQGAGAAGGGVVATAMIRDVFVGSSLVRGLSRVALFTGLAPVLAPFLGAQLMVAFDWRGLFLVVAGYGFMVLVAAVVLIPETLSPSQRLDVTNRRAVWHRYRTLLADRPFVGVALIGGFLVSSVFAYLSTSAFVFQQEFGLSPQIYGVISAFNAVAFVVGTQAAAIVARRVAPHRILSVALPGLAVTGLALVPLSSIGAGPVPVIVTMVVFMLGAGTCSPCLGVLALADHGNEAGTAAALVGAANFGLAGVASPIVGLIGITSFAPLGAVMGSLMAIAALLLWSMVWPRRVPAAA